MLHFSNTLPCLLESQERDHPWRQISSLTNSCSRQPYRHLRSAQTSRRKEKAAIVKTNQTETSVDCTLRCITPEHCSITSLPKPKVSGLRFPLPASWRRERLSFYIRYFPTRQQHSNLLHAHSKNDNLQNSKRSRGNFQRQNSSCSTPVAKGSGGSNASARLSSL